MALISLPIGIRLLRSPIFSMVRQNKTMTSSELTDWINKNCPGFEHPYGNSRGVPQAAFRRAKVANYVEGMDALVRVFTHDDGSPLWME